MATSISAMFAVLAGASIVGVSDQYLALFVLGLFAHLGWIQPAGATAFIGEPWFLAVTAAAWGLTTLPSLIPHHQVGTLINAVSGPITVVSGALFALVSAGMVASVRPELVGSLYLLTRDAHLTQLSAYNTGDVAVLMGGAAVASTTTFLKFLTKPGVALKLGAPLVSGPLFATAEAGATVTLVPLAISLAHTDPTLLAVFGGLITVGVLTILMLSVRWLMQAGRGVGKVLRMLDERPRDGLTIVAEIITPGIGWFVQGYAARGTVTLIAWAAVVGLAFSFVGLVVAVPAYILLARASAMALYQRLSEAPRPGEPMPTEQPTADWLTDDLPGRPRTSSVSSNQNG